MIDEYLDHLRVERRFSEQAVLNVACLLHELERFARSGERDGCRYMGTVTGSIETLDANAIGFFLGHYNHSQFHAIARRTFKEFYRFLVIDGRIDKSPMDTSNADAIFKRMTNIVNALFQPDATVTHLTNWQTMQLTKDANGQYYGHPEMLWGLPVVGKGE